MGIAGMILCIVGLVFSAFPVFGAFIVIPLVGAGLPLSAISFYQARKSGVSHGVPTVGLVTGVVAVIVSIGWIILFVMTGGEDWISSDRY